MAVKWVGSEGAAERLHMRISAEDIAAVDDWRFGNRVQNRSEAVRRLMQIGIVSYREIDRVLAASKEATGQLGAMNKALTEAIVDATGDEGIAAAVREHFDELNRLVLRANAEVRLLAEQLEMVQATDELTQNVRSAEQVQRDADASRDLRLRAERGEKL